jgi:RNA polymerase sigma-70 factor (ECF subfamily)
MAYLARPTSQGRAGHAQTIVETDHLYTSLARLRPEHQSVISLVHLEGLSVENAARILDLAEGTVKSRLHRAREALKRELARTGGRP